MSNSLRMLLDTSLTGSESDRDTASASPRFIHSPTSLSPLRVCSPIQNVFPLRRKSSRPLALQMSAITGLGGESPVLLSPVLLRCSRSFSSASQLRDDCFNSPGLMSLSSDAVCRTKSDAARRRRLSSVGKHLNSYVGYSSGMYDSPMGSTSNLARLRSCALGQSAPQLTAPSLTGQYVTPPVLNTAAVKLRKELRSVQRRHSQRVSNRRSLHANTSPVLPQRSKSPHGHHLVEPGTSSGHKLTVGDSLSASAGPCVLRPSLRGANPHQLMAPSVPDTRRWSVASLPSSSGYGTPGSSAFSSQYSSTERLGSGPIEGVRLGSNDSDPSLDDVIIHHKHVSSPLMRLRSRSLSSPMKLHFDGTAEITLRNTVYKERFPKAKSQMEEKLEKFLSENSVLSGSTTCYHMQTTQPEEQTIDQTARRLSGIGLPCGAGPGILRLLGNGAARFLHHQIMEIAADCLHKSHEDIISSTYFCEMAQNLEDLLTDAKEKTPDSFEYLSNLVRQLLIIVARPARLLECLDFDPDEFYQLLEEAEGQAREEVGEQHSLDLPMYIIGKLGLDRDPMEAPQCTPNPSVTPGGKSAPFSAGNLTSAPKEDDFETIKLISNGAYGAVYLVRHRITRQRFALKKLSKANQRLRNQIDQLYAERDILTFTDNPFVVSFYGSFETKKHLCMLLEYVEGGDCAALLKNVAVLPVDLTRLYIAETVLAIEYLHSYGIVHRDLKPDNLLITSMGHIKLTDFGLSKVGLMNRTTLLCEGYLDVSETQQFTDKQLCGTPEYIAPEVILRRGYGKPVDWWACGIILYEFLVGTVPFFGETPEELFAHVINHEIEWPPEPDAPPEDAKDLIERLLTQNPLERLGTLNGAVEVKSHPLFNCVDWNSVLRQKAEFIPQLEGEDDTSYFDTRAERYNHDVESDNEHSEDSTSGSPMFWSFSSASPKLASHRMSTPEPLVVPPASHVLEGRKASVKSEGSLGTQTSEEGTESSLGIDEHDHGGRYHRTVSSSSSVSIGNQSGHMHDYCDSMDETHTRRRTNTVPLGVPRVAVSCDPDEFDSLPTKELSPVDERLSPEKGHGEVSMHKRHSVSVIPTAQQSQRIPQRRERTASLRKQAHSHSSAFFKPISSIPPSKSGSLHLVIPQSPPPTQSSVSPAGSSTSSRDASPTRSASVLSAELSPAVINLKAPLIIKRGPSGFGFTIRSVRVYLGQSSDYYTIQHIITQVGMSSPAFESGLRGDELLTHVNGETVQNLTHPNLMRKILTGGDQLSIKVLPLDQTSIKVGAPRKSVGKLVRRKPTPTTATIKQKMMQRRPVSGKSRRASLLRRLSGKRAAGSDMLSLTPQGVPLPRSVSSQDGLTPMPQPGYPHGHPHHRLSDVGLTHESSPSTSSSIGSTGSSPASSGPQSPALWPPNSGSRPSSLVGLKSKLCQSLKSPGRRPVSVTMPLSPLARNDTPAPGNHAQSTQLISPSRSPSPLSLPSGAGKKTITKPNKKSSSEVQSSSPLLRRVMNAVNPTRNEEQK